MDNNNKKQMEAIIMFADWIKEKGYESDWIYSENAYLWCDKDSEHTLTSTELYDIFLTEIE